MKVKATVIALLIAALSLCCWSTASSQPEVDSDRTLSPYFFINSDDATVDQLPLKSTSADVQIAGVIADVRVTQVYKNEGKTPLEAIYVFPASTRAAVYGMIMQIGERIIDAKIKKRETARQEYDTARNQGKSASLLEQQRPNVFQMNVANILPGDVIKVELKYTELLVPEEQVYEFVYPTVVGPRYSNQNAATAPASERWIRNPYLHQGEATSYDFNVCVNLVAGLPIRDLASPSHQIAATYTDKSTASVALDPGENNGGNRDFILRYRLDGERIKSGLLLSEEEKEKFFLLMMQPPKSIMTKDIPGREYIFVVDVSGSMHGFPLDISKKLMSDLIENLRPSDRFNVLLFAGGSSLLSGTSLSATPENIKKAVKHIENQTGGGGTEILPALKRMLALPQAEGFSRSIIVVTDGYVTVEEETFDLIRENLGQANLFAFGIGTSVNRHIIEGMSRCGMGEAFVITKPDEAAQQARRFRKMILSPVLTQVKVDFEGFEAYDVEPLSLPDVLANRPVVVFGKWRGEAAGTITLKGITGQGEYRERIAVTKTKPRAENGALRYLWARHRIALLDDYNNLRADEKRMQEVTDLGLRYNLLTAYTSFVAVDHQVRSNGKPATVTQPLPLPQGVSDYAVGCSMAKSSFLPMAALQEARGTAYNRPDREKKQKDERDKTSQAALSLKKLTVSEGLPEKETGNLVRQYLPELYRCVADAGLQGMLEVQLILRADGTVKSLKIKSPAINKQSERCLTERIKKWLFPKTFHGHEAQVTVVIKMS
ncbi:MAG: VWA domain-containing protein [Syntrophaceae bacterium]|nr:VWA domain-containing protein [Syntrophaceae bacterium]